MQNLIVTSLKGANLRSMPSSTEGYVIKTLKYGTIVKTMDGMGAYTNKLGSPTAYRPVKYGSTVGWVCTALVKEKVPARETYKKFIGCTHMGEGYNSITKLSQLKGSIDCNHSAMFAVHQLGLAPEGIIVKHTSKRDGKKCIADAVSGYKALEPYYTFHWVNKLAANIKADMMVEGALLYYNSDAAVYGGDGYIYSCNKAKGEKYKSESDYRIKLGDTSRYVGKSKVLVIAVPKV